LDFKKFGILMANSVEVVTYVTMPNIAAIGQTIPKIWRFIIFQYGGCPPSWVCCALV